MLRRRVLFLSVVGILLTGLTIGLGGLVLLSLRRGNWWLAIPSGGILAWLLVYAIPELNLRGDHLLTGGPGLGEEERLRAKSEVRGTLIGSITGVSVLVGIVFAANTLDLGRQERELSRREVDLGAQQLVINKENEDLAFKAEEVDRRSKHSDQFMKAVQMLAGRESTPEIRAGGIYSLEQLGLASVEHRRPVVETLAAFLRVRAHASKGASAELPGAVGADVQAAITVLGRNSWNEDLEIDLDVSSVDLRTADLHDLRFRRVDFTGSLFSGANLTGADFTGTDLSGVELRGRTRLSRATLEEAQLLGAHFEGADASEVKGLDTDRLAPTAVDSETLLPDGIEEPEPGTPGLGEDVTITTPRDGDVVTISPELKGTWSGIPEERTLWLVTAIDIGEDTTLYFPQGVSFPDFRTGINRSVDDTSGDQAAGTWCKEKGYVGSEADAGKEITILIVGADESVDEYFRDYLQYGGRTEDFPAFRYLPSGAVVYQEVTVTRDTENLGTDEQVKAEREQARSCPGD